MTQPRLSRCLPSLSLTLSSPTKPTTLTLCETCSQPNRLRWSSLPEAVASNHGTMTASDTESATTSNVSSTKSSAAGATSLATKNLHAITWLSYILLLHSSGSNEMSTGPCRALRFWELSLCQVSLSSSLDFFLECVHPVKGVDLIPRLLLLLVEHSDIQLRPVEPKPT